MITIAKYHQQSLPMVAIIGADGSGKSTLIHDLQQQFKHAQVRKIFVLNRAYPANPSGKQIQNYALAPRSSLVSIIKLWMRAIRWLLVYWLELVKIKRNGGLILCDHFYFSGVLLDPLKYRYGGPKSLVTWLFNSLPRPDIFIFLDAPLEVLYKRKQEAEPQQVQALIERHRAYMASIPAGFTVDASQPPAQVAQDVSQIISRIIEGLKIQTLFWVPLGLLLSSSLID